MITIVCHNEDEGPYEVQVNGYTVYRASYDEDGRAGMSKIVNLARSLAEAFGVEVVERFAGDDE